MEEIWSLGQTNTGLVIQQMVLGRWREDMCVSVLGVCSRPEAFSWGEAITHVSHLDLKKSTGPSQRLTYCKNGMNTAEQWLTDREPEDLCSSLDLQPALGCLECYFNSLVFKVHTVKLLGHYYPHSNSLQNHSYHNESLKWHQLENLCFFVSDFVWYSRFLIRPKVCVSFWNK